jgi:hypothetical protein
MTEERHSKRQQAIAALIEEAIIRHGCDFGTGDVVAVHASTIGYSVLDALRDVGLTVTRKRETS